MFVYVSIIQPPHLLMIATVFPFSFMIQTQTVLLQSELLGQFRLIGERASDVSGGRICLTQNAYAEI